MKANNQVVISFAAAAVLVALVVPVSLWGFRQLETAAEARQHSYQLIMRAEAALSDLTDAETGQRGYALTGDEAFLKPYLAVRDSINGHLAALRSFAPAGPAQQSVDAMVPLVAAKLADMAQVIELRRRNDLPAVQAAESSGQGRRLMDSIRLEMGSFVQMEGDALALHEADFQSNMRRLFAGIITVSLIALLFALVFAYLIYREAQQRLKNLVHLQTQHLLKTQEDTNLRLQQANLTLQLSEDKLAVTLNSIGDAVIATDADGRVTLLNPLAERLTGWTQAEAAARPVDEIFHIINQETRQPAAVPVKATLAHGTIQGLANHTVLIARDGSECAIADSCAPIHDRDAKVVGAVLVFRDVTAEYAAQQALRDSAALIQTILDTVADSVITLHAGGGVVERANQAAERMFGYPAEELIGQNFSLLIPELDQDQRKGFLDYYSASAEARAAGLGREVVGRRKNGSTFPLEIAVSEMWLGSKRYFTAVLRDITTRKQAEEALLKAGALQSAIFNSANFSSIATDAMGVIQIFNVGAERMLGYAAAEVMNKITPADISDPQEVIARAQALSAELGTPISPGFDALVFKASRGIEDIYELTYIRKDGSRFPAIVSVTALRDAENGIIGYLLIGTDNTARKQVEAQQKLLDQRLRDQQFYTRSLIESNVDAIMTTTPSGVISDTNKQMELLTGCTRDELIGALFKDYFTEPQRAEAAINLALSNRQITNYELTVRARDGKETVVSFNATTFYDRDRKLQGVFAAARDITEREHLYQMLQDRNAELENAKSVAEKANQAKSDFLSRMSHELRTPLNAVLGFAQVIESSSPPPTPAQKRSLDQILKAGWYLLELINEILDLARIESGRVDLSREPVSLDEIMLECRSMIEPQARSRDIDMEFPHFDSPCYVLADRTRLKQVLINLLFNAIKYNKSGGRVAVDWSTVSPDAVRVSVSDTGAGLSPESLAQLFQPFNRLGQESSAEEGTGIGLVVAKRLVEMMGGAIGVDSTVGTGTVFWIELGRCNAPQHADAADEPFALSLSPAAAGAAVHTLLYVEDNPANLRLVEELVKRRPDLRLLTAADANLGIALAREFMPDVILMDINLPGISGTEAMSILRADAATSHIPIVAISANAMPSDIRKGLEAGFFRYLTKPVVIKEFMNALDVALQYSASFTKNRDQKEGLLQ